MSRLKGLLYSVTSFFRRAEAGNELAEEMQDHVERQTRKHVAEGMSADAARTLALREFGGTTRWREEVGDIRPGHFLDSLEQDARFALRTLRRHRAFSTVAILTLAVGIGGSVAAYAIVDRVLLQPLPYREPETLVSLVEANDRSAAFPFSIPNLNDLSAGVRSFSSIGAASAFIATLGIEGDATDVMMANVSGDLFETLGVPMLAGRPLRKEDRAVGAAPVAVIGYDLWQRTLHGDRNTVGQRIQITGRPYTVIGVAPPGFEFPHQSELWTACRWCDDPPPRARSTITADVVARLAPGVTLRQASNDVATVAERLHAQYPDPQLNQMKTARALPLAEAVVGDVRRGIWMIASAVAFVLLIGCANLASANIARNSSRVGELALRTALGAARRRIMQQLAVESLAMSLAGGALGVVFARWTIGLIVRFASAKFPRVAELGIDYRTVAFAFAVSVVVALFIGLLPALQMATGDLRASISGTSHGSSTRGAGRFRDALILSEVALTLVLVVGAGLSVRSLLIVSSQPLGVDPRGLITISPELNSRRYSAPGAALAFHEELIRRLHEIPRVRAAAMAATPPLGMGWKGFVAIEGASETDRAFAEYNLVSDGYFETLGLKLQSGRLFTSADDSTHERVTVINEAMAKRFWPGRNPIGKRVRAVSIGQHPDEWLTVVGVVSNVRTYSLEMETGPAHYVPVRQDPEPAMSANDIVRVDGPVASSVNDIRRVLRQLDPALIAKVEPLEDTVRRSTADRRAVAAVMSAFGAVAMLLAGIGVYGVLSYSVTLRTRELGIRMALGAGASHVIATTIAHIGWPVAIGVVVGIVAARAVSRVFESLVFHLSPTDPAVLAVAALAIVLLSLLAAFLPTRRAAAIDPMIALRSE